MSKNFDYSLKDISSNLEKSLKEAELLGEGHNGVVFLLKNKINAHIQYWIWALYHMFKVFLSTMPPESGNGVPP